MATATRSTLRTPLCDLLGIRYPVCQAGMAFVARPAGELIATLVDEASAVLARLPR